MLYKLDLGIDHILIDEAQDTSPRQWDIIRALASEFTAGAGARSVERTLFAVGDDKQSIFSFQGADPKIFELVAKRIQKRLRGRGSALDTGQASNVVPVRARPCCEAVDIVFKNPQAHAGFVSDPRRHRA